MEEPSPAPFEAGRARAATDGGADARGTSVTSGDDVAALVVRAQAGERGAFESLVRRHQRTVYFLCLRYVSDPDEAEDLTQRTFVRAMGNLRDLRTPETFRAWLLRVAVNFALNHRRDHARFVHGDAAAPEEADVGTTDLPAHHARLEHAERAAVLRALVATLPPKQRLTLELRIYDDLPFKEIAEILEISEGAAKVNFHYAVRKLKHLLGPSNVASNSTTFDPVEQGEDHDDPR